MSDLEMQRATIVARAKARGATHLNDAEDAEFRRLTEQLEDRERRGALSSSAGRVFSAAQSRIGGQSEYRPEGSVYTRTAQQQGVSFVRDLLSASTGGTDAGEARRRLEQHTAETRDVAGLNTITGNSEGFSFAPPQYALDAWARFARAGSPLYNLLQKRALLGPEVKVPKLTAGITASEQSSENTSITTSEFTDEYLSTTAKTVAAAAAVSQQLIDLSPLNIDDIVFQDMFAALAQQVDNDLWYDSNFGVDTLVQTTYTLPTATETDIDDIYGYLSMAINFVSTTRYLPPDVSFAHPSVVNHLLSRLDPDGRPLVLPSADAFNPVAIAPNAPVAQGESLRILGLPVISDPNISTSANTSAVYVMRLDDSILFTNGPVAFASPQPLAIQLSWLLRVHTYLAPVHRYPESSIVKVANFNTGIPFGS
jgi:HK97 family phage major capsid protein